MASLETYNGTANTSVNAVVATSLGGSGSTGTTSPATNGKETEDGDELHGATNTSSGIEGIVLSGHEDHYIRFFDANSGMLLSSSPLLVATY